MDENADPVIRQYREKISDNDRALVEALNKRLRLVAELKKYKESRDVEFVDVAREEWILQDLARANRGPVSDGRAARLLRSDLRPHEARGRRARQALTAPTSAPTLMAEMTPDLQTWAWIWRHERGGSVA